MHYGVFIFPTDYSIRIDELCARGRRARVRVAVRHRAHSTFPRAGVRRSGAAARCRRSTGTRSTRSWTDGRGGGNADPESRHRPSAWSSSTNPITLAKDDRHARSPVEWALPVRIGGGWNAEEMEDHGTVFKSRFQLLRERILAMKEIWTKETARVSRRLRQFSTRCGRIPSPSRSRIRRCCSAARSTYTLQRVVDFCEAWFPRGRNADAILPGLADLKRVPSRPAATQDDLHVGIPRPSPSGLPSTPMRPPGSRDPSSDCRRRAATRSCRCSTSNAKLIQ